MLQQLITQIPYSNYGLKIGFGGLLILFTFSNSRSFSQSIPVGAIEFTPTIHGTFLIPHGDYVITSDLDISGALTINSNVNLYVREDVDLTISGNLQVRSNASLTICEGAGVDVVGAVNVFGATGFPYKGTIRLGVNAYLNARGSLILNPESDFYVNDNSIVDVCASFIYHNVNHIVYEGSGVGFYLITRSAVFSPFDSQTMTYSDPSSSEFLLWLNTSGSAHDAPKTTGQYCGEVASSTYCDGSSSTRAAIWPGTEQIGQLKACSWGCGTGASYAISNREVEPEITVLGNSIEILDGDLTSSILDNTDFGQSELASSQVIKTYKIRNDGDSDLILLDSITTSNSDFTITQPVSLTITGGTYQTFDVYYDPVLLGVSNSIISITSNDGDEANYDFQVSGEATPVLSNVSIDVNYAGWHYISFACDSIRMSDVSGISSIKGYVQVYDELSISSDDSSHSKDGWVIPDDLTSTVVYKGDAIAIYTDSSTTISYSCTQPVGEIPISLINTCDEDDDCTVDFDEVCPAQGWNLIGNPYPFTVDFEALNIAGSDVSNSIYFWDPLNDRYAAYVDGVGVNGGSRYIAPGQGFFIYSSTTNSNQLVFNDDARARDEAVLFRSSESTFFDVTLDDQTNTIVRFKDMATTKFDIDLDAFELNNPSTNNLISTRVGNVLYSVNSIPDFTDELMLNLSVSFMRSGVHELNLNKKIPGFDVYLIDNLLSAEHHLAVDKYRFESEKGLFTNRFQLKFLKSSNVTSSSLYQIKPLILFPNPVINKAKVISREMIQTIYISDIQGRQILREDIQSCFFQVDMSDFSKGIYLVHVIYQDKTLVTQLLKK